MRQYPITPDGTGGTSKQPIKGSLASDIASHENSSSLSPYVVRSLVNNNVRKLNIPQKGGHWSGPPGDSYFILDDDAQFPIAPNSQITISGREIKKLYLTGGEPEGGILYHQGDPDFSPIMDKLIGKVPIEHMPTERKDSYALATQYVVDQHIMDDKAAVKAHMKKNGLVWHECGDCHTMMAIPWIINAVFKHTGGIGVRNQFITLAKRTVGNRTLYLVPAPIFSQQRVRIYKNSQYKKK